MTNEQLDILIEQLDAMRARLVANQTPTPPVEQVAPVDPYAEYYGPSDDTVEADNKKHAYQANQKYFVTEAMQNFPEAAEYGVLRCTQWRYEGDKLEYKFKDVEDGTRYTINLGQLMLAADLVMTEVWHPGLTRLPPDLFEQDTDYIDEILGQMDGTDFCALAEIAIFGKVVYC